VGWGGVGWGGVGWGGVGGWGAHPHPLPWGGMRSLTGFLGSTNQVLTIPNIKHDVLGMRVEGYYVSGGFLINNISGFVCLINNHGGV
jgi:hypothetical protein